jgi:hypothetical protein
MKSRALTALLLLFLWTFVPGINMACAEAPKMSCSAGACDCCADEPACLCEAPAPSKSERPVATPASEFKLPLIRPSEPLWNAVPIEAPVVPILAARPATATTVTAVDTQTRFCTFLL